MSSAPKTPLEGLRMLDLGRYQAGPRCALMFARMGAEVIKVESLDGDVSRKNGPTVRGQSAYWVQYNSGKKSLAINLRTDEGKEVLRELVKVSDFFLQNFRPGTIETMGFGYDVLKNLNPRIVMLNVSAYGQYGPYSDRVGFDPIGQALGGMMSLTGFPDGPPVKTGFSLIDRITALHATIGALAALRECELSGEGQAIDVCLADTGFTTNEIPIAAYLGEGIVRERSGNGAGFHQTSNGWIIVSIMDNDTIWRRACEAFGRPELPEDERFSTRAARSAELQREMEGWLLGRTTKEALDHLTSYSVPCAPVNNVEQAAKDPHWSEREILVEVPDPIAGSIHVAGKMIKFSRTPMEVGSAPMVGEHTEEVLRDILGYTEQRIQALQDQGVLRCAEPSTVSG